MRFFEGVLKSDVGMNAERLQKNGFLTQIRSLVSARKGGSGAVVRLSASVGEHYVSTGAGLLVTQALGDPFFPLSLFVNYYAGISQGTPANVERAASNLALLCRMFTRIRTDIDRCFGNRRVTCVDLDGDGNQDVASEQWCSLCGECCQLAGTVPDAPSGVAYPGYWYNWLAGDGPMIQKFCPFLFELPARGLFFCAIHNVKPMTCRAYAKEACLENHPGMARD